ncbi:MAG: sn-glycerol-1-phosphate dehydrogenase [Clostridiaceae bacterium]|jgi:glycerol-1-phosphate dehydrogenase [NAD(P)+]|nr:sn-glycerol-1-phosphate dehydrogenase [Clostridiaceae bacterium]
MDDILEARIEDMPGMSFECGCGRRHSVDISRLVVGSNILGEIAAGLEPFRGGKLLVISDNNTYRAFGEVVINRLLDDGFRLKSFVFDSGDRMLLPDERSIGRALLEVEPDTTFILVVGSGVLSDIARIVSYRTGKQFAIVATAPSMDGYTSVGSSLVVGNKKITYYSHYPYAIFADTSVMRRAPMIMIQAGFGDVLGKLTALADWHLARDVSNEYYCGTIAKLVRKGVDKCLESAGGLAERDEHSVRCLIDALILTGLSIGLAGVSRPASGTEHQLAHYWEVKAVEEGKEHPLHGNSVGVGTVVTAMLYELASEILPEGIAYPRADYVRSLLGKVGAFTNPGDLGISRELFTDSMMNAMYMRDKYTVLRYCSQKGRLEEFAGIIAGKLYS